ncbi:MAG: hypothetical protein ACRELG_26915, partial [Gemmataceae bacterium]
RGLTPPARHFREDIISFDLDSLSKSQYTADPDFRSSSVSRRSRVSSQEPTRLARSLQRIALIASTSLSCVFLISYTIIYACYSLHCVTYFHEYLADGAFQLFNPLRRIAAGQHGGVDFQFFHGLGIPYLHYPFFRLFGGGLHGSEGARHLVSFLAYMTSYAVVFQAATRRIRSTLLLLAAAMPLSEYLGFFHLLTPGNSLIGVRSSMPILLLAILLLRLDRTRESLLFGLGLGAAFVLGTEQGLACIVATVAVQTLRMIVGEDRKGELRSLGVRLGVAGLTAVSFFLVVGGFGGLRAALYYNLVDVPRDQFWYFGAPPNPFFSSLEQLQRLEYRTFCYASAIALSGLIVVFFWFVTQPRSENAAAVPYLWGLVYGLLTTVSFFGMSAAHYLLPLQRILLILGFVLIWTILSRLRRDAVSYPSLRLGLHVGGSFALLLLLIGNYCYKTTSGIFTWKERARDLVDITRAIHKHQWRNLAPTHARHFQELTDALVRDLGQHPQELRIWSTYAGLLEDQFNIFHPDRDYIIHTLGKGERARYLDAFRQTNAPYAYSLRKSYFRYEEWLQNTTWPFYEELFLNYEPLCKTFAAILWKRKAGDWRRAEEFQESFLPDNPELLTIPLPKDPRPATLLVVQVEYDIHNRLAGIPFIGQLPRYLLYPQHCLNKTPISLCPYEKAMRFAVVVNPGETPQFRVVTESLVGGSVTIKRVWIRPLQVGVYLYPEIAQNTPD